MYSGTKIKITTMHLQPGKRVINKSILAFEVSWPPVAGFDVYNKKYRKLIIPDSIDTNSAVTIF